MADVFLRLKTTIREKKLPVTLCWEFRDESQWMIELEETSSGARFCITGNSKSDFEGTWDALVSNINAYKKKKTYKLG